MPQHSLDAHKSNFGGQPPVVAMPTSTPPIVHDGKKKSSSPSPTAVAPSGDRRDSAEKTAPSIDDKAATPYTNSETLRGKTFVQKIHAILEVPKYSSIISWNDAGNVATIYDSDAFISEIVPLYFKKSKFGSFIRKMRRWGFSAITKKSDRGHCTVIEFSSEHFLRDRPDLCKMMKDERHVKKQFSFLDPNMRNMNHENIHQGSSVGVHALYSQTRSNMNSANYQTTESHQLQGVDNSISPMISPNQQSFHNPQMQMMNMMMPTHHIPPQQLNYPPYGYGAPPPPPQGGVGFGSQSPPFQYPAPDGYPSYPPAEVNQQQHQQMMQQNTQQQQQQLQQQQNQYLMMQQNNQQCSPSVAPADLTPKSSKREVSKQSAPTGFANANTSTAIARSGGVAVLTSSSEESTALLRNTKLDLNVHSNKKSELC
eukprot:scaffold5514_cov139-Skeletonema_menzelii.AAC.3